MARTKGSNGEATKARIRMAAGRLMAELGYDGLTMRGIGNEIGLRAGAIYRYFPDKATLASDLVSEALAERDRAMAGIADTEAPTEALEAFVSRYLSWRMSPGGGAEMIRLCLPALGPAGQALGAGALAPEAEVETILAKGQDEGAFRVPDTQVTARVVIGVLDEVASDERLPPDRRTRIGWSLVRRLVRV